MDYSSLWDVRIFLDLYLGGIGVGIFLFMAFGVWGKGNNELTTLKFGAIASFALVAIGAFLLVSELGKPLGILSTITGFNPTSVTSWGGLLQMGFLLVNAALCALLFMKKGDLSNGAAIKAVGALGVCLAACILVYHGLVLNSVGRGLWADAFITPLFMASSVIAGGAIALVIDKFASKVLTAETAKFVTAASLCVGVLMLAFGFTVAPAGADAAYCYNIMMEQSGLVWWLGAFGVGVVVPLALSVLALVKQSAWNASLVIAIAVCALAGSLALKSLIASTAQIVIG